MAQEKQGQSDDEEWCDDDGQFEDAFYKIL